ncbi:MFS multidrug transporter-like protein [Lineolata rhizophorae]|uniref:MFS multidrug transporter-like protein n=1 Tax=Lineolata rhizophorae TaxID=578093 RepID=A0A6A6NYU3_9PEZI|nr:MFS multidrug transporter-like protein [Lineolata rhizophorae]
MDSTAGSLAVPGTGYNTASVTPSDLSINEEKEKMDEARQAEQEPKPEADQENQEEEYPKALKLIVILVALALSIFLVALDMTIVATAIPRITDEFQSLDQVGWYGSAFFLTIASFQSTWGKAYKYFPLKWAYLQAIFWFEVGSLICAVAQDSTTLIVGRAIAGAGGAGLASGAYTIIAFSAPPKQTGALTGLLGAVYAVASVIGPLLGGVFTDNLTWRWCFYINLPIGGLSAAIILALFQTPKAAKPVQATWKEKILQMDPAGTFLLMAAIVCLILSLQWGGVTKSWGDAEVIGTLVGFVLILAVFVGVEIYLDERALLVPRLLKNKTVAFLNVFQFFNSGTFLLLLYYLPIYFQVVSGVSAADSGIRNLPYILGIALLTIVSGGVITVTGHYIPMLVVGAVLATIGSGLIYTLDAGTPSSEWIGYQALSGIGIGLGIQVPIIVGQAVVDAVDVSSATAIIIFFQTLSGAIFVSVGQSLFANQLVESIPENAPGVNPGLVVATGATELRDVFPSDVLPGVIRSYMDGLKDAYALGIAMAGVAVVTSVAMVFFDRRNLSDRKGAMPAAV